MVVMIIEVHVKPEKRDEFLEVIKHDASHSEADEPGCLRFDVLQDNEDSNKFYYYEVYRDEAARAAHRETPHFKEYAEKSADMFDAQVVRHLTTNYHPDDANWR
jgi:autoinducer 2-degrading protein